MHPETGLGLDAVLAEHAAAAPGALPLLSFTLDELYKSAKARGEAVLTHASYEALGGLEGAIANRADEIVAGLPAAAQAALPRVLRALTTVSEHDRPGAGCALGAARKFCRRQSGAHPDRRLHRAARLLVAASEGGTSPTVRLAHEALISRWQRARDQLAADRRDLETQNAGRAAVRALEPSARRARRLLLLRNPDLANAVDLAKRWGDELDAGDARLHQAIFSPRTSNTDPNCCWGRAVCNSCRCCGLRWPAGYGANIESGATIGSTRRQYFAIANGGGDLPYFFGPVLA